jgi:hypothetical protein
VYFWRNVKWDKKYFSKRQREAKRTARKGYCLAKIDFSGKEEREREARIDSRASIHHATRRYVSTEKENGDGIVIGVGVSAYVDVISSSP